MGGQTNKDRFSYPSNPTGGREPTLPDPQQFIELSQDYSPIVCLTDMSEKSYNSDICISDYVSH